MIKCAERDLNPRSTRCERVVIARLNYPRSDKNKNQLYELKFSFS